MLYKFFPLLLAPVMASPLYSGVPLPLENIYPGINLQQLSQASALINNPLALLYQYGNLEQIGALSKGLLTSHLGGQKSSGLSALALTSPNLFNAAALYPLKMAKGLELPEKTIAGALVKQVPKVSKLPIAVSSLLPKSLELSSLAQSGLLEEGLAGSAGLAGKAFLNNLGISLGGRLLPCPKPFLRRLDYAIKRVDSSCSQIVTARQQNPFRFSQ